MATTSGIISSAGIGSGLDVNSIVTKLMAVEQQPLTKLQTTNQTLQTQLSTFGQMQANVAALHDAAAPLFNPDSFALTSTGSSDPSSVTAGTSANALPGSYTVNVSALSAAQSLVSANGQFLTSTATVGTGSLTITLGTWAPGQTAFTAKSGGTPVTIPIGASENTLAGIRDKINAANAGVAASIITDASGARLSLQSTSTGLDNGFQVKVADDDTTNTNNSGLSRLAYDPPSGAGQLTLAQAAANTVATINGISVSSATNIISDVVPGITFSVNKTTSSPTTINVTRSTDPIKAQLNNFISAYNQLNKFIADQTKYDASKKTAALLQGDSTAVGIQNQLRSLVGQQSGASTTFTTLSSLGVQLQTDGSLVLNDAKFSAALTNLPEVAKALSTADPVNDANSGFAKKFSIWTDKLLSASGTLPSRTKAIQDRITQNQKDQDAMSLRLSAIEQRMRAQYSALDTTMSQSNALASYMTQQIANWNKNTA